MSDILDTEAGAGECASTLQLVTALGTVPIHVLQQYTSWCISAEKLHDRMKTCTLMLLLPHL